MTHYEYKVVPAPTKGKRVRGVRGHEARFALALQDIMNQMGAAGWEYQRAETLPSEERHGLTSVTTTYRNVLVFRRPKRSDLDAFEPRLLAAPDVSGGSSHAEAGNPDAFFGAEDNADPGDGNPGDGPARALLRARAEQQKALGRPTTKGDT